MVKATERLIKAEKDMINSVIKYAIDDGELDSLDSSTGLIIGKMMSTINAANEVMIIQAKTIEEMRKDLIEMNGKLIEMNGKLNKVTK